MIHGRAVVLLLRVTACSSEAAGGCLIRLLITALLQQPSVERLRAHR